MSRGSKPNMRKSIPRCAICGLKIRARQELTLPAHKFCMEKSGMQLPEREHSSMPEPPIYLVSCVSMKVENASLAEDLYISDWFQKAKAYVHALGAEWLILSAEHGLVRPDQIIFPYDRTLTTMTANERNRWGYAVIKQLETLPKSAPLVILAGKHYRAPIEEWARDRVTAPMAGMGIGEQKAWLTKQTVSLLESKKSRSK